MGIVTHEKPAPEADQRAGTTSPTFSGGAIAHEPERKVELIAVGRLKPYRGNSRTHSRKQIKQIARALSASALPTPS